MPRVANTAIRRQKHRRLIARATGFRLKNKNVYRRAKERLLKAAQNSYRGRRLNRRSMHALMIARVNAGARSCGVSYSVFMAGLKKNQIELDRKVLSQIADSDSAAFAAVVSAAQK